MHIYLSSKINKKADRQQLIFTACRVTLAVLTLSSKLKSFTTIRKSHLTNKKRRRQTRKKENVIRATSAFVILGFLTYIFIRRLLSIIYRLYLFSAPKYNLFGTKNSRHSSILTKNNISTACCSFLYLLFASLLCARVRVLTNLKRSCC